MDVPTSFSPFTASPSEKKNSKQKCCHEECSQHLTEPDDIASHANYSRCSERQNQHFPNDKGGSKGCQSE